MVVVSTEEQNTERFNPFYQSIILSFNHSIPMDKFTFVKGLQNRTKQLAIRIIKMYEQLHKTDSLRIVGKQIVRSSTSTAANYRAACRARSKAEFFAKMSIVVEEADETVFWLELLEEGNLVSSAKLTALKQEATEVLSIVAKARKNI